MLLLFLLLLFLFLFLFLLFLLLSLLVLVEVFPTPLSFWPFAGAFLRGSFAAFSCAKIYGGVIG